MKLNSKEDIVFITLAGFFITNAIVAELIGGKLFQIGPFVQSIGIMLWPVVFLTTDLVNEYYGPQGVRKLTLLTVLLIGYTFILLAIAMLVTATPFSPVSGEAFKTVFGQSLWIILGSIVAFMTSQLVDVSVFWALRKRTGSKMIWLRATGSTVVSQLVDTFIVQGIAFVVPGVWTVDEYLKNASAGYIFKLGVAVAITPVIYFLHYVIDIYLAKRN
jgi:queuosine precursor transporter